MRRVKLTGQDFEQIDFGESEFKCSDISVIGRMMKLNIWGIVLFPKLKRNTYKYLAGYAEITFQDILYACVAGYDHKTDKHYIKVEWGDVTMRNILNSSMLRNIHKHDQSHGVKVYVIGDVIYYDKETGIEGGLLYVWCKGGGTVCYNPNDLIDDKEYIFNIQKYKRPEV